MAIHEETVYFYETQYEMIEGWVLRPGQKVVLGDPQKKACRFCGKSSPEVTFKKVAHAIPESLGNKSLVSAYECDTCNEMFGQGIENDLGNWSKPMRTFARIRGKKGVPTLVKNGASQSWRVEYAAATGFTIKAYEHDPTFTVNEAAMTVTFKLKRDPYTPVAVLKAFMQIGLTLMPEIEVPNFPHVMAWVRQQDHSIPFADNCPIIYSFQPGPMPNDVIAAFILRRKPYVTNYPYMYLILGYGNEAFQIQLPSQKHDGNMNGQTFSIPPFPTSGSPFPERFGKTKTGLLDLTSRQKVTGESTTLVVGFEEKR